MKISPMPSTVSPVQGAPQASQVENVRAMRMKTNATPLTSPQQQRPAGVNSIETQATAEATQPLSPQLALLAKQRRALQVKERELREREKAMQSNATGAMIDSARLKSEPLSVLLENGVTYDQLTEAILANSGQGNSEINALKAEIEALKQGVEQKFVDQNKQAEQQVLAEMRREADQLVRDDNFEFVRETRSVPTVMSLIERTYRSTGEVLDVSEAMQLVENELFKDAQKLARLKKMQIQSLQKSPPPQPQQRQYGMRTLTNRYTSSVPLSAKERALAAFNGTLKR